MIGATCFRIKYFSLSYLRLAPFYTLTFKEDIRLNFPFYRFLYIDIYIFFVHLVRLLAYLPAQKSQKENMQPVRFGLSETESSSELFQSAASFYIDS